MCLLDFFKENILLCSTLYLQLNLNKLEHCIKKSNKKSLVTLEERLPLAHDPAPVLSSISVEQRHGDVKMMGGN